MTNDYKGCVSRREKTSSEQSGFIYGSQEMRSLKQRVLSTPYKQLHDETEILICHIHSFWAICSSGILFFLAVCMLHST